MTIRCYSELAKLLTFEDRFNYLRLSGGVGIDTFGFARYLNQRYYHSAEWKRIRRDVIIRDLGCDLGIEGYELNRGVYIHHMNPLTKYDIENMTKYLTDPEYLICCSHKTHNLIHYGADPKTTTMVERSANDTSPWRVR